MKRSAPPPDETLAYLLAMVAAADGRIDERELSVLDRLDAFRHLGCERPTIRTESRHSF